MGEITRLSAAQAPGLSEGVGKIVPIEGGTAHLAPVGPRLPGEGAPALDYETRVDADGDGTWDEHRAVERGDGGVDILVDRNRDGLIDSADVDLDHDAVFEAHFVDDTGDGWLDRRVDRPQ